MLATTFGAARADKYRGYMQRMLGTQRAMWPWLNQFLTDSPRRQYDLLDVAVSELLLLVWQNPGVDPLHRPEGGSSLLVRAWAEATRYAWKASQHHPVTGRSRHVSLDEYADQVTVGQAARDTIGAARWAQVHAALAQEAPEPEDLALDRPEDHPRVSFEGLTVPQLEALTAYAAGLSFAEVARLDGRHPSSVRKQYRTAVRRLLAANPWLVELYGGEGQ